MYVINLGAAMRKAIFLWNKLFVGQLSRRSE